MNAYSNQRQESVDILSVFLYIVLIFIGFISISSSTSDINWEHFKLSALATKQIFFLVGAFVIIISILFSNVAVIDYFAYGFYGIALLLNVLVVIVGHEVKGAKSWFGIGGFGLQPSEFAKVATALALAKFLGTYGVRFKGWKNISISLFIFLVPMVVILLQDDTGSALVFLSFFLVLFREGLPGWVLLSAVWLGILSGFRIIGDFQGVSVYYGYGLFFGVASLLILFFRKNKAVIPLIITVAVLSAAFYTVIGSAYHTILQRHQKSRIESVLGLKEDAQGIDFHVKQSKIAIGAGKFWGRGFMKGTQTKMGFVPEQHTDFIFDTIAEEWGFFGATLFFIAFIAFLLRLATLAERQTTTFGRVLGYSLLCVLFFHFTINIGMTIGLMPVIGIPLPFISYGGSSLWAFTLFLFIFLRVDQVRK